MAATYALAKHGRRSHGTTRGARSPGLLLLFVAVAVIASLLSGCSRFSAPPLSNAPENLHAAAKPATVGVYGTISADVTVPDWKFDKTTADQRIWEMYLNNELDYYSDDEWESAFMGLVVSDPLTYIQPDPALPARTQSVSFGVQGSGFIVDPDGYVVTNAHVAAMSEEELKTSLASDGLAAYTEAAAQEAQQILGTEWTPETIASFTEALKVFNQKYIQVGKVNQDYQIWMGAQAGSFEALKGIKASVVAAGEAIPGKDVAILKVQEKNLPTLPLGDDESLKVGQKLYIIGYPAAAEISKEAVGEPTWTDGVVSAKKQEEKGFEVVQMDADVHGGNSGGPVLDSSGRVVGIATYGVGDPDSGGQTSAAGIAFMMPTTLIKEFVARAGAKPRESTFSKLYKEALCEECAYHNQDALALYRRIDGMSPGQPYIQEAISRNERFLAEGKDRELNPWTVIGAPAAAVILIAGGLVAFLLVRRRRAPAAVAGGGVVAAPAATATEPAGGQPTAAAYQATAPPGPAVVVAEEAATVAPTQPIAAPESAPAAPVVETPSGPPTAEPPGAPAPVAAQPQPGFVHDPFDELKKLHELKDAGVITEEEFDEKKNKLLGEI